jgi:hypothetical protein
MTDGLLQLSDWLAAAGCTQVAIGSTGVCWRPVFKLLEGNFEVILVNAHHRLTTRLGKKRVLVAVGHSILVIAYHLLSKRASYAELGGDYFDRQNARHYQNKLVHKLEARLKVSLEPATTLSEAPL